MKQTKPKFTRQHADGLFPDLKPSGAHVGSRPDNPFGEAPPAATERRDRGEKALWKDNLITVPMAIALPPGYESAARVREALTRAWRMKWVREAKNEIVAEFAEGWTAVRPASGPVELRDAAGVVRALYGWAEDAEFRILPRYRLESQENSTNGLGSLVVRDRERGLILERSSTWSAQTGTHHPDWARLSAWLDAQFPLNRDPLRLWTDCEKNRI